LPDESVDSIFSDPPYADQIPYAHLSDFFYGFLQLGLKDRLPEIFSAPETEKAGELTENRAVKNGGVHDREWYEKGMQEAFTQMKKAIREDGTAAFVFAHKDTDRWEALVSALIKGGWCVTGSWPIETERKGRMRAHESSALATSVHLICRPRPANAPVGEWAMILEELPRRVGDWMERLQGEKIRGADLIFACIGPALEIFSRCRRVETPDGREISLTEYLGRVWEAVGRAALEQVLSTAEARARNGAGGALEEDARLTALFLWTLETSGDQDPHPSGDGSDKARRESPDEEEEVPRKKGGWALPFDVVKRFAQPLGINLHKWEERIIKTEKGDVRLLPVRERARQLFGNEEAGEAAKRFEKNPEEALQMSLFPGMHGERTPDAPRDPGDLEFKTEKKATTLDKVHAAMLFQLTGKAPALRSLIAAEEKRGQDFRRLANALAALYPRGSEERRLLEALLLAMGR